MTNEKYTSEQLANEMIVNQAPIEPQPFLCRLGMHPEDSIVNLETKEGYIGWCKKCRRKLSFLSWEEFDEQMFESGEVGYTPRSEKYRDLIDK